MFAAVEFKRGDRVCRLTGREMTVEEAVNFAARSKYGNTYFLGASWGILNVEGPARYANDACGLVRIPGLRNNCRFVEEEDGTLWLEATRRIQPGEECLVGYGKGYWNARQPVVDVDVDVEAEAEIGD